MNNNYDKAGFTLVELLVAVGIILAIVTMVYGSYFATSESARIYKDRLSVCEQVREVLDEMAKQIRCSYADTSGAIAPRLSGEQKDIIKYFEGNQDAITGEILHFVTTHGIFLSHQKAKGLFDVIYKFDRRAATLYLNQTSFIGVAAKQIGNKNWRLLLENVSSVELTFFDGKQWVSEWNFKQKRKVPRAVKISITCEDENQRQYSYGTISEVCCWNNRDTDSPSEALTSVDKQVDKQ